MTMSNVGFATSTIQLSASSRLGPVFGVPAAPHQGFDLAAAGQLVAALVNIADNVAEADFVGHPFDQDARLVDWHRGVGAELELPPPTGRVLYRQLV